MHACTSCGRIGGGGPRCSPRPLFWQRCPRHQPSCRRAACGSGGRRSPCMQAHREADSSTLLAGSRGAARAVTHLRGCGWCGGRWACACVGVLRVPPAPVDPPGVPLERCAVDEGLGHCCCGWPVKRESKNNTKDPHQAIRRARRSQGGWIPTWACASHTVCIGLELQATASKWLESNGGKRCTVCTNSEQ